MSKKSLLVFAGIFLFLLLLNYLTPMSFGDDYVYSFMWQGKSISEPLPPDAVRVSSWKDLFASQWLHYFTWGGRAVTHVLIQFFLWMGKNVFNYFNACVCTFLVIEIYYCIYRGKLRSNFEAKKVFLTFVALWAFTPAFSQVFFWIGGSLNYVWTTVYLLFFLIPYIRKYYHPDDNIFKSRFSYFGMFLIGILAGWSNENTICWIILLLCLFLFSKRQDLDFNKETWLYTGLAGLVTGYGLLMLSPGNANRFYLDYGQASFITRPIFIEHCKMAGLILIFHVVMWYFCIRSFFSLKKMNIEMPLIRKEITLAKCFCFLSFSMCAIMFFSPEFPPRSAFQSTVFLILASGVLLRLQEEYKITLIKDIAKKFLIYAGSCYFVATAAVTVYSFYNTRVQYQALLDTVKQAQIQQKDEIITVKPFEELKDVFFWSGMHTITYVLSEDVNSWSNVAFSRYYGIKGIRVIKDTDTK